MEGVLTVPGEHWGVNDIEQDSRTKDGSGQIDVGKSEQCYLEKSVDRREQIIAIYFRSGFEVFRQQVFPVFHKVHQDHLSDDLANSGQTCAVIVQSSLEGSSSYLSVDQSLPKSPDSDCFTDGGLGTTVENERHICKKNGSGEIFTEQWDTLEQEEFNLDSRLPAQTHRDKGTCTVQKLSARGDQTNIVPQMLDSSATANIFCTVKSRISVGNELSENVSSNNNTIIVSGFERSFSNDDDGRNNQVSQRLLERRETTEVDKDDLSGLEVRHTSCLNFSIDSQEQHNNHSVKSELNIVWGKTIDTDEVSSKERLFRSELRLYPSSSRSLDDSTDYFSGDMSSDTIVTSDFTDSFVETGDSLYATDSNDSFLEAVEAHSDNTDANFALALWKYEEEDMTNNTLHSQKPLMVSKMYVEVTKAFDVEPRGKIYETQLQIGLVDDAEGPAIGHSLDKKLLYKVSDTVANLGRGASDAETAEQRLRSLFPEGFVCGVDQADSPYLSEQDSCLQILDGQVSNRPISSDEVHSCDALGQIIQKSAQYNRRQSQKDIRDITFDVNTEVRLDVSKTVSSLELLDGNVVPICIASGDSSNNNGDDVQETVDNSVVSQTRPTLEDLRFIQPQENATLTVSGMKQLGSLNLEDRNSLVLPSVANAHDLLDGSSENTNTLVNIFELGNVSNDTVCSIDSVKCVTTDNILLDDNNTVNHDIINAKPESDMTFMTQEMQPLCADGAVNEGSIKVGSIKVNLKLAGKALEDMNTNYAADKSSTSLDRAMICDTQMSTNVVYPVRDKAAGDETVANCVERTEVFLQKQGSTTCQKSVQISKSLSTAAPNIGLADIQRINQPNAEIYLPLSTDKPRETTEATDSFNDSNDGFVVVTSRRKKKLQKRKKKIQPATDYYDDTQSKESHNSNIGHSDDLSCQIVEASSPNSLLVHIENEKDETISLCSIPVQNPQDEKMERLPPENMFSPPELVHTDQNDAHISSIEIACAGIELATDGQPVNEQNVSVQEMQSLGNNTEQPNTDLTMAEVMFESGQVIDPLVFSGKISNPQLTNESSINGETVRETERFKAAAEDSNAEEFISRILEGTDAHTQEYADEFLHSDECGGMLLNMYTGGHRRILKPHRRFTKHDIETAPRSGTIDSDFKDPGAKFEGDERSVGESTVDSSDVNESAEGTGLNDAITMEGRRRGKGHKRKREGISTIETPMPENELSELNVSDDSSSIGASLDELDHIEGNFGVCMMSDEDKEDSNEQYVSLFDQQNNVSDEVNEMSQHVNSHADETRGVSDEVQDDDFSHDMGINTVTDSDTQEWPTYRESDTLIRHVSVTDSGEIVCNTVTDGVTSNIEKKSSDMKVSSSTHHKSEMSGSKKNPDISCNETESSARQTDNDSDNMTWESSVQIEEINDANVNCFPGRTGTVLDADQISVESEALQKRLLGQIILEYDSKASLEITKPCDLVGPQNGNLAVQNLRQESFIDKSESFTIVCAPAKVTLTKHSHAVNEQLTTTSLGEAVTAVTRLALSLENVEGQDLGSECEPCNIYLTGDHFLKELDAPNYTEVLSNRVESGAVIDREQEPQSDRELVSVELQSDVSNTEDDLLDLRAISARIDTLLDDTEESAEDYVDDEKEEQRGENDRIDNRTEDISVRYSETDGNVQLAIADSGTKIGDYDNAKLDISDEYLDRKLETDDQTAHSEYTSVGHEQKLIQAGDKNRAVEDNVKWEFDNEEETIRRTDLFQENNENIAVGRNENIKENVSWRFGHVKWESGENQGQRDGLADAVQVTEANAVDSVESRVEDIGNVKWESDDEEQARSEYLTDGTNGSRNGSTLGTEGDFIGNNAESRVEEIGNVKWESDNEEDEGWREVPTDRIQETDDQSVVIESADIQTFNMDWRVEDIGDVKWESVEAEERRSHDVAEITQERNYNRVKVVHTDLDNNGNRVEEVGDVELGSEDESDRPSEDLSDKEIRDMRKQQVKDTHLDDDTKVMQEGEHERKVEATDNVEWECNNEGGNIYLPYSAKEANDNNVGYGNENSKADVQWRVEDIGDVKWESDDEGEGRRDDLTERIEESEDNMVNTEEWRVEDIGNVKWESDDEEQCRAEDLSDRVKQSGNKSSAGREEDLIADNKYWRVEDISDVKCVSDVRQGEDIHDRIQKSKDASAVCRKSESITDNMHWSVEDIGNVKWKRDDEEEEPRDERLDRNQDSTCMGADGRIEDSIADNGEWKAEGIGDMKLECGDQKQDRREDLTSGTKDSNDISAVDGHEYFVGDAVGWRVEDIGDVKWESDDEADERQRENVAESIQECRDVSEVCRNDDSLADTVEWRVEDIGDVKWESDEEADERQRENVAESIQECRDVSEVCRNDDSLADTVEWRVEDIGDVKWESDEGSDEGQREDVAESIQECRDVSAVCRNDDSLADTVEWRVEDIGDVKWESDEEEIDRRKGPIDRVRETNDENVVHKIGEMRPDNNQWISEDTAIKKWEGNNKNGKQGNDLEYRIQESIEENVVGRVEDIQLGNMNRKVQDTGDVKWESDDKHEGPSGRLLDKIKANRNISSVGRMEDHEEWRFEDIGDVKWDDDNKEDECWIEDRADRILLSKDMNKVCRKDDFVADNVEWRIEDIDDVKWESDDEEIEQRDGILDRIQDNDAGMENRVSDNVEWRVEDIDDVKWESDDEGEEKNEDLEDRSKEIRCIRPPDRMEDFIGDNVSCRVEDTDDAQQSYGTGEWQRGHMLDRNQETNGEGIINTIGDIHVDNLTRRVEGVDNDKDESDEEGEGQREGLPDKIQGSEAASTVDSVIDDVEWRFEDMGDVKWESYDEDEIRRDYLADRIQASNNKSVMYKIENVQTKNNQWKVEDIDDVNCESDEKSVERKDDLADRTQEIKAMGAVGNTKNCIGDKVTWRVEDIGDVKWESDDDGEQLNNNLTDESSQSSFDKLGYFSADNAASKIIKFVKCEYTVDSKESTADPEDQIHDNKMEVAMGVNNDVKDPKLNTGDGVDAANLLEISGGDAVDTENLEISGGDAVDTDNLEISGDDAVDTDNLEISGGDAVDTDNLEISGGDAVDTDNLEISGGDAVDADNLEISGDDAVDTDNLEISGGDAVDTDNLEISGGDAVDTDNLEVSGGDVVDTENLLEISGGEAVDTENLEISGGEAVDTDNLEISGGDAVDIDNLDISGDDAFDTENLLEISGGDAVDTDNLEISGGDAVDTDNLEISGGDAVDTDNLEISGGEAVDTDNLEIAGGDAVDADNLEISDGEAVDTDNLEIAGGEAVDADNLEISDGDAVDTDNLEISGGDAVDTENLLEISGGDAVDTENLFEISGGDENLLEISGGDAVDADNLEISGGDAVDTDNLLEISGGNAVDTDNLEISGGDAVDAENLLEISGGDAVDTENLLEISGDDAVDTDNLEISGGDAVDTNNLEISGGDVVDTENLLEISGGEAVNTDNLEISGGDAVDTDNLLEISGGDAVDTDNLEIPGGDAVDTENLLEISGDDAVDTDNLLEISGGNAVDTDNLEISGGDAVDTDNLLEISGGNAVDTDNLEISGGNAVDTDNLEISGDDAVDTENLLEISGGDAVDADNLEISGGDAVDADNLEISGGDAVDADNLEISGGEAVDTENLLEISGGDAVDTDNLEISGGDAVDTENLLEISGGDGVDTENLLEISGGDAVDTDNLEISGGDAVDAKKLLEISGGNTELNDQNTSVLKFDAALCTQNQDLMSSDSATEYNYVKRNEQIQGSIVESVGDVHSSQRRQPVVVCFTDAITDIPESKPYDDDNINSVMDLSGFISSTSHQPSVNVSASRTSDILHTVDNNVHNRQGNSATASAPACVHASVLLVDNQKKTILHEPKQKKKKNKKKKNAKKNVQERALEHAVKVKASFGEKDAVGEIMGVAAAADKLNFHYCCPDESDRDESLRGFTADLVVDDNTQAGKHSRNTVAGPDDSVKSTEECFSCEYTLNTDTLCKTDDVENNKTENKTINAIGKVEISQNDSNITEADSYELSSSDNFRSVGQVTANKTSVENSGVLLNTSIVSSHEPGCYLNLDSEVKNDTGENYIGNMSSPGDLDQTGQRVHIDSSIFDDTLVERYASVTSNEYHTVTTLDSATRYQTDDMCHPFVDRLEMLIQPTPKPAISKHLLEDVIRSKARAKQLVAQNPEVSQKQIIHELKSSSEEATLTPAGHLMSEIGLLETSARDQLETLDLAVAQQTIYETELQYLNLAIEEAKKKLQASPITADSVGELKQLIAERTNLTEQIKRYHVQVSEIHEKSRQLALDSAQLSPSVFRKHYHPESAYSDYFAATSQHKRGPIPFHSPGQLFYDTLPVFNFPSFDDDESSSSLAGKSRDELENWKQLGHQKSAYGMTPISLELPRLIPQPRADSIPRPTWSGEILTTAASSSDMSRGTSTSHSMDSPRTMAKAFETSASSPKSVGSVSASTRQTDEVCISTATAEAGPQISQSIDVTVSDTADSNVGESSSNFLHCDKYSPPAINLTGEKLILLAESAQTNPPVGGHPTQIMPMHGFLNEINKGSPTNWNSSPESDLNTHESPSTGWMSDNSAAIAAQHDLDIDMLDNLPSLETGATVTPNRQQTDTASGQDISGETLHEQDTQEQINKQLQKLSDLILQCEKEDPIMAGKLRGDLLALQRDLEQVKKGTIEKQLKLEVAITEAGIADELGPDFINHMLLINEIADQGRHSGSFASNVTTSDEIREDWERLSKDLVQRKENLECILRTQKPEDQVKISLHSATRYADSAKELEKVTRLVADFSSACSLQQTQIKKKQFHPNEAFMLQQQHQSVLQNVSNWLDLTEEQLFTVPLTTEEQIRHSENLRRQIQSLQDNVNRMNEQANDQVVSTDSANRELIEKCHSSVNERVKMIDTTAKLQAEDLHQTERQWRQYQGDVANLQGQLQDIQNVILLPTATQSLDQLVSNNQKAEAQLKICENQLQELKMKESSLTQKYPKGVFKSELVPLQSKYIELHRKAVEKKSTTQSLVTCRDQYQKMLKDCADFLETAENKLQTDSLSVQDLSHLKQQLAAYKEFFSDIEVHKAMLNSLANNCDPSTRSQFQQQSSSLSTRIHVLVDQASLHEQRLERLTGQWAALEDKYTMLQKVLLSLEAQMPESADSQDSLAAIQDQCNKYRWLQGELAANRDSVFQVVERGKQILHSINCPSLETTINELANKWVSLNTKLTQELKRTESLGDLMSVFETEFAVLSSWLITAKMKLAGFKNLSAASLQNIGVVRNEVDKILEFRKEVANQLLFKNKVMSIGNQLLQNKSYDTRGLSGILQDYEEEWRQLVKGISDTQEYLLKVQMRLMPSRQALKELTDWIGEMSKSVEKDAFFVSRTAVDIERMVKKYKGYQTELTCRQMSKDFVNQLVLVPQPEEVNVSDEKLEFAENLSELNKQWQQVTKEVLDKLNELEDVYSKWEEYGRAVEKLQSWFHQQEDKIQSYRLIGNEVGVKQTLKDCSALQEQLQTKQTELAVVNVLGNYLIGLSHDSPDSQLSVRDSLSTLDQSMKRLEEHIRQRQSLLADMLGQWTRYQSDLANLNQVVTEADHTLDHYKLIRGDITTLQSQVIKLKNLRATLEKNSDQLKSFSALAGQLRQVCEPSVQVDIQKTVSDIQAKWTQLSTDLKQRCNEYEHYLDGWQQFENQYRTIQDWLDAKEVLCMDLTSINIDSVRPETLTKYTQLQQDLDRFQTQVSDLRRRNEILTQNMNPSTVSIMKSRQSAVDQKVLALKQTVSQLTVTMSNDLSMREKFKEVFEAVKTFLTYAEGILAYDDPVKAAEQEVIQMRFNQLSNLLMLFSSNCEQLDEVNDLGYQLALSKIDATRLRELNHKWYKLYEDTRDRSRTLQDNLLQQQDFTSKCETWKTFITQAEQELAEKVKGNLSDLSDQLHNCEKFENELYSRQQIIHAIISDGQKMIRAGEVEDKDEFQRKLNLLSEKWQSVSRKANQRKTAIQEIVNQWRSFNTLSQQLKDWLKDTENYVTGSQSDSSSLQSIKNSMGKVQAVKHEFQVQEATYNKILDLGDTLLQHADNRATKEIKDTLSEIQQNRHKVLSALDERRLQLEDIHHQWVDCESQVDDMLCQLTEIRSILNADIPTTYDELQIEINRCRTIEKECIESENKEQYLLAKKEQLVRTVQTEDMSLLQQRIQLLTKRREELQHQTQVREDKVTDALFRWSHFNEHLQSLMDWIENMTTKIISNQDIPVEDLLAKLENEYQQETETKEVQKAYIIEQGRQLMKLSNDIRASEIEQKLLRLDDKWQHLKEVMDIRLHKLRETVVALHQLDTDMSNLSQWLLAVENVLNEEIIFKSNDLREMQAKVQDSKELQQDIEHHETSVSALLSLCEILLIDSDACPTEKEYLALKHSKKNLEKRWQTICMVSPQRRTRVEETWQLWKKFQDDCGKFSQWITQIEQEVRDSEFEVPSAKEAKTLINKYEVLQRNIQDHLSDLDHINRTYCQLVKGCTTSDGAQKDMMTRLNERWDALQLKVTEIMKKLCSSSVIREDFEATRISLVKWLTEFGEQLTRLQHPTALDMQAKVTEVKCLDAEVHNKRYRIKYLDQAGVHLMQKADSQEALRVQREMDKFRSLYKSVLDRFITVKLQVEHMSAGKTEDKSAKYSSEDRHQQLDGGQTRELQNVSGRYEMPKQIAELEKYLEESPPESPSVRQKSHVYNSRGSLSPSKAMPSPISWFGSPVRRSQSPSFLRSMSPTLRSVTLTRSVSPHRRSSPSQRSPTRLNYDITGQARRDTSLERSTKIDVLMEQLVETLNDCDIKFTTLEQRLVHIGDTKQSLFDELLLCGKHENMAIDVLQMQSLVECEAAVDYVRVLDRLLKTETGLTTIDSVDAQVKYVLRHWEYLERQVKEKNLRPSQDRYDLAQCVSDIEHILAWLDEAEALQSKNQWPSSDIVQREDMIRQYKEFLSQLESKKPDVLSINLHSASQKHLRTELKDKLVEMNRRWKLIVSWAADIQRGIQPFWIQHQEFLKAIDDCQLWLEKTETQIRHCEPVSSGTDESVMQEKYAKLQELYDDVINYQAKILTLKETADWLLKSTELPELSTARDKIYIVHKRSQALTHLLSSYMTILEHRLKTAPKKETHHDSFDTSEGRSSGIGSSYASRASTPLHPGPKTLRSGSRSPFGMSRLLEYRT